MPPNFHSFIQSFLQLFHKKKKVEVIEVENQSKHILIIEDKESLRKRYADILISLNFRVTEASNNIEAFQFFKTVGNDLHLIITNIERKDGNGFDMLSKIHEYLPYDIPVLLISSQIENYKTEIDEAKGYKGVKSLTVRQKPLEVKNFIGCIMFSNPFNYTLLSKW